MTFIKKIKKGNKIYLAEVRSVWKNGKPRHEYIRYIGKMQKNEIKPSCKIDRLEFKRIAISGQFLCLKKISEELGLPYVLEDYTDGRKILLLAVAHCINPASLNKIHFLGKYDVELLGVNEKELKPSKFLWAIDKIDDEAISNVERELWQITAKNFGIDLNSIFYDITSIYFYGKNCKLAKKGYSEDEKSLPQAKIGLAIARSKGFPIFHEVFEGNIYDSKTLKAVLLKLKENGIKGCILVLDRGMASKNNIYEAKKAGFDAICGMPLKGRIKQIAGKNFSNVVSSKNAVLLGKGIIYAKEIDYFRKKLLICVNEKERVAIKEARMLEINKAVERIRAGLPIKEGIKKYIKNGKGGPEIDYKTLEERELLDGVYSILSTRIDLKKEEIVRAYFEKDLIERAFRALKGIVEIRPVRHWLSNRVKAHVFICYLSYLLISVLQYKLEKFGIKDERGNRLSASRALDELSTVYRIVMQDRMNKNVIERTITFSKLQDKILKALGLHSQ